ncbi:Mut7-C RNAse domain-containing protein [Pseudoduganella lutea]|uniref:Twitching motility protein PilT n=1 Tax=Pseudoduganella lutea TaxID=321985 RepID=A0A4V0Z405_9BURK|nr:Mut7-C RNAse domain-containing protein [Pseudoduganella lutea]QBE65263.1 twitching motility protein PilT [Pseudoduganella lutea]
MVTATFRFDSALDMFLAREHRGRAFAAPCARAATVKHMVEALGVPHTEAGEVLVNGAPVPLDHLLEDGDDVHVPAARPVLLTPSEARFVADAHLGGLARLLRMAGFDTLYDNAIDDGEVEAFSELGGRIALTRDRELLKRRGVLRGCYVRALKPEPQLREVFSRYGLQAAMRPFTLCLACNVPLQPRAKEDVLDRLPSSVRATQDAFLGCPRCGGVFWQGSHWRRMRALLDGMG